MALEDGSYIGLEHCIAGFSSQRLEQISHDFRTPLNIIIGYTELLLDERQGKINDEQRQNLNDILKSAGRLLNLVNDVFSPPLHNSAKP